MSRGVRNLGINPTYKSSQRLDCLVETFPKARHHFERLKWRRCQFSRLKKKKKKNSVCLGFTGCYVTSVCVAWKRKKEKEPCRSKGRVSVISSKTLFTHVAQVMREKPLDLSDMEIKMILLSAVLHIFLFLCLIFLRFSFFLSNTFSILAANTSW